jgi:hypothetical protein
MVFAHGGELVGRALKAQGISTLYTLCGGARCRHLRRCL